MDLTKIEFFVPGVPAPGGSKRAMPVRRKGGALVTNTKGNPITNVVEQGGMKTADWKTYVRAEARKACPKPLPPGVALAVGMAFVMPRPKYHFHTGKKAGQLRSDAPMYHTKKPDLLKLQRSTEDAMTGVVYHDDAQTSRFDPPPTKVYGDAPGVHITVRLLEGAQP